MIAAIERDVAAAKVSSELSAALEACDDARSNLLDARDENCRALIGSVLCEWIRSEAIERSRPQVFHRANEHLVRFTHGKLELVLDDRARPPAFKARRGTGDPRPVGELSTGERVQMLMAVRMAFLEQDASVRLPLLLDESLGTSDDARAGMIIDSVIEIARGGRQVFYFSAQQDEIGKWVGRLQPANVPYRIIDLAEVRRLATAQAHPLHVAPIERAEPVAPEGMSREEYGRVLGVPGLNPAAESLDGLHLWHVVDDPMQLHRLVCQQVTTWGQLRTLVGLGGAHLLDGLDHIYAHAAIVTKAIDAACQAWRIGRGRPVDRAVLQDSGHVSAAFIDTLCALATNLGNDARTLMAALDAGQVSHWRAKNTEGLRTYFEEHGLLPSEAPLAKEQIRLRVVAAVSAALCAGRVDEETVDRIVGSLPP